MWNSIKSFFFDSEGVAAAGEDAPHDKAELRMAAAGLLATAAISDGGNAPEEEATIKRLLVDRFEITEDEADGLFVAAHEKAEQALDIFQFTRVLADHFTPEERIEVIEMLWEVVYADGRLDDFEAHLMRRCAGLLFVSDRDSGLARQRVRERLGV